MIDSLQLLIAHGLSFDVGSLLERVDLVELLLLGSVHGEVILQDNLGLVRILRILGLV